MGRVVIKKNLLKELKKGIRKLYPKPYTIKDYNFYNDHMVDLINESGQKMASFKYDCLDGVLVFGSAEALFSKEYQQVFDVDFDIKRQELFQKIVNVLFDNKVVKELTNDRTPFELNQNIFQSHTSHIKRFYLNKHFAFLEAVHKWSCISFCHQIYADDAFKIRSRMKIEIEFRFSGVLVFYYDYATETLQLGTFNINDEYAKPYPLYHDQSPLFGLKNGDTVTLEQVKECIDGFMEGVHHQLIIKAYKHYNIESVLTDDITLENKNDYLELLKMKTI